MPRVTVVIPTFGRAQLVCRAVEGVLRQTVSDIEIIVVIDGDDPATRAALASISDDRLRCISHPARRGAGMARNTGIEAARGNWIAFLDDDDEWLPQKLEKQLAAIPAEPAVITALSRVVTSLGEFVRPGSPYDGSVPIDEWLFDRQTWSKGGEAFVQTSSLMAPRALFDAMQFTEMKQHEDWEFVIRAVKEHGHRLVTVNEPLVIYYLPEMRKSLSQTFNWQHSIAWAEDLGPLLTRKAFSGFLLTVVAQMASTLGWEGAFPSLLKTALRKGRPSPKQLFAFAVYALFPSSLRLKLRAVLQAEPRESKAAAGDLHS